MEKSKALVDVILSFYTQYVDATKDGRKLTWIDLFRFGPALLLLSSAVTGFNDAVKEWETATDADRAGFNEYVKTQFNIADQVVEAKIEAGISIAVKLGSMVDDVKVFFQRAPALTGATA